MNKLRNYEEINNLLENLDRLESSVLNNIYRDKCDNKTHLY